MNSEIVYRSVRDEDISAISQLHISALPMDLCSILGLEFLIHKFYPKLMEKESFGLVAEEHGVIIGFVIFSQSKNFFRDLVFSNFLFFTFKVFKLLINPMSTFYILGVLLLLISSNELSDQYELCYIAVDPGRSGKGVGSRLLENALTKIRGLGVPLCWVKTLESTPENIKFYQKFGFNIYKKSVGRVFLKYSN